MEIIVFCILKLISISIASTQSDAPYHVCEYAGVSSNPTIDIPFSVADVPVRCNIITYGKYHLGSSFTNRNRIYEHDEDAIKSLVAANKSVYIYVGYNAKDNVTWNKILDPQDQAFYDQLISPLIEKIEELRLTGIILDILDIYDTLPDMANKISAFVTKLKEQMPDLKFVLGVYPVRHAAYTKIPNKELFDYTITNFVIDLYFIDLHFHDYECSPELSQSGTIITSSDKNVMSLELLSNVISQSTMDQTKTIACIIIFPLSPNSLQVYTPYSQYCNTPGAANSTEWCLDNSQRLYEIGAFLKNYFAGIAVDWIEHDDVQGLCQCQQQFPVTNTIFDGWDGTPISRCDNLN